MSRRSSTRHASRRNNNCTIVELESIGDKAFKFILKPAGWKTVNGQGLSAYIFVAPGFTRYTGVEGVTKFESFAALGQKVKECGGKAEKIVEASLAEGATKQAHWDDYLRERLAEEQEEEEERERQKKKRASIAEAATTTATTQRESKRRKSGPTSVRKSEKKKASNKSIQKEAALQQVQAERAAVPEDVKVAPTTPSKKDAKTTTSKPDGDNARLAATAQSVDAKEVAAESSKDAKVTAAKPSKEAGVQDTAVKATKPWLVKVTTSKPAKDDASKEVATARVHDMEKSASTTKKETVSASKKDETSGSRKSDVPNKRDGQTKSVNSSSISNKLETSRRKVDHSDKKEATSKKTSSEGNVRRTNTGTKDVGISNQSNDVRDSVATNNSNMKETNKKSLPEKKHITNGKKEVKPAPLVDSKPKTKENAKRATATVIPAEDVVNSNRKAPPEREEPSTLAKQAIIFPTTAKPLTFTSGESSSNPVAGVASSQISDGSEDSVQHQQHPPTNRKHDASGPVSILPDTVHNPTAGVIRDSKGPEESSGSVEVMQEADHPDTTFYFPIIVEPETPRAALSNTIPLTDEAPFDPLVAGEDAFWHHLHPAGWRYENYGEELWRFFAPDVNMETAVRGVTFFESYQALGRHVRRVGISQILEGSVGRSPPLAKSELVAEILSWLQGMLDNMATEDTLLQYAKNIVDYGFEKVPYCQSKLEKSTVQFLKRHLGMKPAHGAELLKKLKADEAKPESSDKK